MLNRSAYLVLTLVASLALSTSPVIAQGAGFDYHLVKPVKFEKVQQILASVSEKAT